MPESLEPGFVFSAAQFSVLSYLHLAPQAFGDLQQGSREGAIDGFRVEIQPRNLQDGQHTGGMFALSRPLQGDFGGGD